MGDEFCFFSLHTVYYILIFMEKIPVTIDKSHLVTVGERLYTENVELLRELVNNAYDADAERVKINISENEIVVEDDGSGMDLEGLKQYFNIGSPFKKENPKSPKFGRMRIGEFGIGKFSVLSNCDHFEVFTKKKKFAATVIFNKEEWSQKSAEWELPLKIEDAQSSALSDGTKVILKGLRKKFDLENVERRLIETLPLKTPSFSVYLNEKKLSPRALTGRKLPFLEGTDYGIVHGEIVILPESRIVSPDEVGILVRVKQVAIRRLSFGLEPDLLSKITGEVNVDFLPLTTDRNDFIKDAPEFETFNVVMKKYFSWVNDEFSRRSDEKENSRVKRAMREVTQKIEVALLKNKEWCPHGLLPIGDRGENEVGNTAEQTKTSLQVESLEKSKKEKRVRVKRPRLKQLSPSALIKKIKIGQMNLAMIIDHFGSDGPESFLEGEIIYINRDHPLYTRESKYRERHIMNIARLLCQEISLMSKPKDPRHAYERQSKLLRDAFV